MTFGRFNEEEDQLRRALAPRQRVLTLNPTQQISQKISQLSFPVDFPAQPGISEQILQQTSQLSQGFLSRLPRDLKAFPKGFQARPTISQQISRGFQRFPSRPLISSDPGARPALRDQGAAGGAQPAGPLLSIRFA